MIDYNDIKHVRPIADNINEGKRIQPYINEVEKLYLIPYLGAKRFKEISENKSEHEDLFKGGFYDEDSKYFAGLNEASGYLVYSRFLKNNQVNVTAFGVVVKQGQFSEQVDEKTLIRSANDAEKIGLEYLNQCLEYLNQDSCKNTKVSKRKFRAIG
jgi:hypothetical protein